MYDRKFLAARIDNTKSLIVAYEDAALAFAADASIQSYTIDTGQSRQTVTRADADKVIGKTLDVLNNRLATLQARLTGANTITARPGW